MIEVLSGFPENVAAFLCKGHVTRAEYKSVLEPHVDKMLSDHKKIRLYYETDEEFDGIDPSAVWEDTMVGLSHLTRWDRMAVVTDIAWIKQALKIFHFVIPGEIRLFAKSEAGQAKKWISGS